MKITIGAVVKGGTSIDYETGDWRDQRPVVNYEACRVCGICRDVCPDSSVIVENERYVIDYRHCKGCGICAFECPTQAIKMVPEEK